MIAGYVIFTVASVPAMLVAGPHELGCDDCPTNVLLIHRDVDLANVALGFQALLYVGLFVIVLVRLARALAAHAPLERLQLTPVYVAALLTFLLVTAARRAPATPRGGPAFIATALLPFAFLAGLLRSHVARLDAELRARWRSCAPRARGSSRPATPSAGGSSATCTTARRRGSSALALLLGLARTRVDTRPEEAAPARPRAGRAEGEPGRAARARARHPPRGPHRRGLEPALRRARRARAGAGHARDRRRASACPARRGRRVLRRRRGARERRQVRAGDGGDGRRAPRRTAA